MLLHAPMEALAPWAETMRDAWHDREGWATPSYTMIYVYELEGGVVQVYTAGQFYTLTIVAGYTACCQGMAALRLQRCVYGYGYCILRVLHNLTTTGLRVRVLHSPAGQPWREGHAPLASTFIFLEARRQRQRQRQRGNWRVQCQYIPCSAGRPAKPCTEPPCHCVTHAAGATPWIIHTSTGPRQTWHRRVAGGATRAVLQGLDVPVRDSHDASVR